MKNPQKTINYISLCENVNNCVRMCKRVCANQRRLNTQRNTLTKSNNKITEFIHK